MSVQSRTRRTPFVILALVCAAVGALTLAAPVSADNSSAVTFTMFNCTGPAGTPSSFVGMKESGHATAIQIVGTNEIFDRQGELDLATGQSVPPPAGLVSSGLMVTCEIINPYYGVPFLLYGKIAQTSP